MITRQHSRLAGLLAVFALMAAACSSNSPRPDTAGFSTTAEQPAPETPAEANSASALVGQWEDTHTMPVEFRADGEVHHGLYGRGTYRMESDGRLRMDFDAQSVFATFTVDGSDTITLKDQFMGETYVLYRKDTGAREAAHQAQSDATQAAKDAAAEAAAVVPSELLGRWASMEKYAGDNPEVIIDIRPDYTADLTIMSLMPRYEFSGKYTIDHKLDPDVVEGQISMYADNRATTYEDGETVKMSYSLETNPTIADSPYLVLDFGYRFNDISHPVFLSRAD